MQYSRKFINAFWRKRATREVYRIGVPRESLDAALDRYFPPEWPSAGARFYDNLLHLETFLRDIRLNAACYPPLWVEAA